MSGASEGSSRSYGRVALVALRKLKAFLGGASGGMQGGPRRGRSPITGPALLRAAQASQTPPEGGIQCPKGRMEAALPQDEEQKSRRGEPVRLIYANPTFAP